jgi:S-adenosylmethionine/arginine decarboxylase-like enzyme
MTTHPPITRTYSMILAGDVGDPTQMHHAFILFVNSLGLTVLGSNYHVFPGNGLSSVALLAESHAALHTWPECDRAILTLCTCGSPIEYMVLATLAAQMFRVAAAPSDSSPVMVSA